MNKKLLRKQLKNKLKEESKKRFLTIGFLKYYSQQRLLSNFKKLYYSYIRLQLCKVVSLYYPLQYEIDCRPIIRWLWSNNITVVLPKVAKTTKVLQFHRFSSNMVLKKSVIGIKETINEDLIVPEAVIMPLIGFDVQGYRLGHGYGYYDTTICDLKKSFNIVTIGLGYHWQEVFTVYPDQYDTKLNAVVTNKYYKIFTV